MWDEIAEVINNQGVRHIVSSKSSWTDLEVESYARLVFSTSAKLVKRISIN